MAKAPDVPIIGSALELIQPSYRLALRYSEQILFLFLLPALLLTLGELLLGQPNHLHSFHQLSHRQVAGAICLLIGGIWTVLNLGPGLYFRTKVLRGEAPSTLAAYRLGVRYFWPVAVFYVTVAILAVIGLFIFVVPGLIVLYFYISRFYLTQYYIVDKQLSIREAMQQARRHSQPNQSAIWTLLGVQIISVLVVAFVSELTVVGLIIAQLISASLAFLGVLRYTQINQTNKSLMRKKTK